MAESYDGTDALLCWAIKKHALRYAANSVSAKEGRWLVTKGRFGVKTWMASRVLVLHASNMAGLVLYRNGPSTAAPSKSKPYAPNNAAHLSNRYPTAHTHYWPAACLSLFI